MHSPQSHCHWSSFRDLVLSAIAKMLPPDPGRLRTRQAVRAVAAGALTLALAKLLGAGTNVGLGEQMLGFVISLFLTAFARDATPAAQRVTMLLAILPAVGLGTLAAMVLPVLWLTDAGFVVILTLTTLFAARGPRASALGTIGLLAYVVSVLGHATVDELPVRVAVVVLAIAIALAVRETLWSERPPRVLIRVDAAMRRRVAAMILRMEEALDRGFWSLGTRSWLREAIQRLDEAAVLAETLTGAPGVTREAVLRVIELDIGTTNLARRLLDRFPISDAELSAVRGEVAKLREAIELAATGSGPGLPQTELGGAIAGLSGVIERAVHLARASDDPPHPPTDGRAPPPRGAGEARAPVARFWLNPAVRRACQVAVATSVAIVIGGVVPTRWYWAGFIAFAVIVGTRSRGESVRKAIQFLNGTLCGVVVGVLLATALAGYTYTLFAICLATLFLSFQAWTAAYSLMTFWMTIALGLAFGVLGYFAPGVLFDRLVESVVGACAGIVASSLVLPIRAVDVALTMRRLYWQALGAVVTAAVPAMLDGRGGTAVVPLLVTLDARLQDLRTALRARWRPPLAGPRVWSERPLRVLLGCHIGAHALGQLATEEGSRVPAAARAPIESEAQSIEALARLLSGDPGTLSLQPAPDSLLPASAGTRAELAFAILSRLKARLRRAVHLF
jgi:hypothetical protein